MPLTNRITLTTACGVCWTLRPASATPVPLPWPAGGVPAAVPGEVHTALLDHGMVPDPFDGANETALAWIGHTGWTWTTSFELPAILGGRHDLVLAHIDTVATVLLNGSEVGRTANQHRTYRFEVGALLTPGTNELEIRIEAPYAAAERLSAELGPRPLAYPHPYNAIRKMASAYGWDWGPDLAGAGLLGDVALESWSGARVAAVRPHARVSGDLGLLDVEVDLEWADVTEPSTVRISCGGQQAAAEVPAGTAHVSLSCRIPDVAPWWPVGYGDPSRYDLRVDLDDEPVWQQQIGFRTVTLSTAPDAVGSEFVLSVNGRSVYVKGANWIPDDALMSRLDADSYRRSITDATDAGMNLLRVWGGGIYEREEFYDVCDELGLLVWQDFAFACAAYAEEEPLASEVEAEAREALSRLAAHPSLVIWNGNNENIWGFVEWGWRIELGGATWGDGYYTDLLPRLVAALAPGTVYTAGSPFSFAPYHHPNDPRHGTMHIWDVWNERDYSVYADYQPRFVAEFGIQGPPAWSTLRSVVHDEPLDPYGPELLVHQKAADGNLKLERALGDHLPHWGVVDGVAEMDDWHWVTQLNQARGVAFGISHFRSLFPLNRGAVVWQLNDCWPVISWAAVDAHGIRKPLWHALKRVFADRFVTLQPASMDRVVLHNDTDEAWSPLLVVTRRGTGAGSPVLATQELRLTVAARSLGELPLDPDLYTPGDAGAELVAVHADGVPVVFGYFVEDTALSVLAPTEAYEARVTEGASATEVTVTAHALVKDLTLFPDRLDADVRVDTALVTLLAGDTHTFVVSGASGLDLDALTRRPVLRSVNDLIGTFPRA